jgi:phenylacetate-CoA ligase
MLIWPRWSIRRPARRWDGECGELILSTLDRTACPLLRYRTGDWVKKKLHRGRLILDGGILSRLDDMVVVRGVNIYPSAVEAVVRQFPEVIEFMVEQRKVDAMDEIELLVEVDGNVAKPLLKRIEPSCVTRFLCVFQ